MISKFADDMKPGDSEEDYDRRRRYRSDGKLSRVLADGILTSVGDTFWEVKQGQDMYRKWVRVFRNVDEQRALGVQVCSSMKMNYLLFAPFSVLVIYLFPIKTCCHT